MCQLRARRVNREHDTSTASTMRHLRARCVNREHNASTASTTRCSRTSHVCNALPASTMHRPAFTMRQPACNNNDAVLPRLLCVVSHVVEPNDASTVGTTRQPPRERRVNRGNDMSTVSTTRQPRARHVNCKHNVLLVHVPCVQRIACIRDASPGIHNASSHVQQQRRRSPPPSLRRVPRR